MTPYWRNLLRFVVVTVTAASVVTVLGILPYYSAYSLLRPARALPARTPGTVGIPYEDVRFSGDGVELAGWFMPGSSGKTIIIIGGINDQDLSGNLGTARALRALGYSLLLYDGRAYGASGGDFMTFGYREPQDALGAIAYLKTRDDVRPDAIALLGYSLGGAIALQAAALSEDVQGVVADSAFATLQEALDSNRRMLGFIGPVFPLIQTYAQWQGGFRAEQVRPVDRVGAISPRPVMFIHGTEDGVVPVEHSRRMYQAAREPKDLWLVPGSDHVKAREEFPEEYHQRVGEFFRRAFESAGG